MKRCIHLLILFAFIQFNVNAQNCAIAVSSVSENFNATVGSSLPACWSAPGGGVSTYSDSPSNPNKAVKMSSFSSEARYLVLPKVTVANGTLNFTLRKLNSAGGHGHIEVGVMTSATGTASFTPIYSTSIQYASTQSRSVSFANYNGLGQYIAIRSNRPTIDPAAVFMIDNVSYSAYTTIGDTIYVDKDATGNNDGSTWTDAYSDLQSALTTTSFNRNEEIWVAEGTYTPDALDRNIAFEFPQKTKLFGGFVGNETMRDQRDPSTNKVTLSGDLLGNDNANIIQTEATRQDNSYNVIKFTNASKYNVFIDGVTIADGNANGPTSVDQSGAAILMHHNTTSKRYYITMNDVVMENNSAIFAAGFRAFPKPVGSVNNSYSSLVMDNSIVRNNHSQDGSTFYFIGNANHYETCRGTFRNSLFHNNTSVNYTSCIYTRSIYNPAACSIGVQNCTFANNSGLAGEAIRLLSTGNSRIQNTIIYGNGSTTPLYYGTSGNVLSNNIVEGSTLLGTVDLDPKFVDAPNGDFNLEPTSGAINFGNNSLLPSNFTEDLAGNPRIFAGKIDAGAFEAQSVCLRPLNVQANNISNSSVSIDWDGNANSTGHELVFVLSGQPIAGGTTISNITTNSQPITGLTALTDYDVYVNTTCNTLDTTSWSSVLTFTTADAPIYVDKDATGANDGSSWVNAFVDIQTALPLATATKAIWVAEGTYIPGSARTSTFNILNNTKIYGGFNGTEPSLSDRDIKNNLTILSGDLNGDDNAVLLDTEPTRQDNAYHVVSIRGNAKNIVVDGFVISNGNANGAANNSCSTAAASQSYNLRGAAIYGNPYSSNHQLRAKILNCVLELNTATRTVVYSGFTPCGVTNLNLDIDFENCIVRENYSALESAMLFSGSGTYNIQSRGSVVNCLFYDNVSNAAASCLYLSTGGGVNALNFDLVNTTFANNTGLNGNVIRLNSASKARIHNVIIHGNGSATPFLIASTTPTFNTSIVEGGQLGGLNVDPLFIDAANDNYTPACASPAIDAANASAYGMPTRDVLGNPRTNVALDMGAIEFQGLVTSTTTNTAATVCSGDSYTFVDGSIVSNITASFIDTSNTVSSVGCDSTVITAVTVNSAYNLTETASICSGDGYTFPDGSSQNNITSTITQTSNLQTTNGCDSVIVTTVSVTPVFNLTESANICAGDSYTFPDGSTQTNLQADVTYTSNLQTVANCDSIIVTTVTIKPVYNASQSVTVCTGSNYTFPDGSTQSNITANTSQTSNLNSVAGCDSVIVTNIIVTNSYTIPMSASICSGDDYTFADGSTQTNITSDVTQTSTLQSTIGCDSNIVTTITVNPTYNLTETASVCSGDGYTFPDGSSQNNITSTITQTSNLQTTNGCDSVIVTTVSVTPVFNLTESANICAGDSYTFPDGSTQTNLQADVTYTSNLQTVANCDSIIVTTVTVKPTYNLTNDVDLCSGANYTFPDGSTQSNITAGTSQTSMMQTIAGCDSVVVTNINIITTYNVSNNATICEGDSYTFADGTTQANITSQAIYASNLQSTIGCDSIVTTTINVNPTYNATESIELCSGSSYTWPDGTTSNNITVGGVNLSVLQTVAGCDSTIRTNFTVNAVYSLTETDEVCSGESYTFPDGSTQSNLTAQVIYTSNLQTVDGCDSTIRTTVEVNPIYNLSESATVCTGESYTFPDGSNQVITAQTVYTSSLQTSKGCDSTIVTTVGIITAYNVNNTDAVCSGASYTFADGTTQNNITSSVVYTSNLTSTTGCDSIIETTLTVNPTYSQTESVSICSGDSYTFPDGSSQSNITADVTYTSNLQTVNGCDSLFVTSLSVIALSNVSETVNICRGEDYTFPDGSTQTNISAQTTHVSVFPTISGCDSTITTTVKVKDVNPTTIFDGEYITPVQTGTAYQWLDCNNGNAPIPGATSISFAPQSSGSYAVEIDQDGCVAVVGCITVTLTGIFNNEFINVKIYPNPVSELLKIEVEEQIEELNIYNSNGALVKHFNDNVEQIEVSELAQGVYFIEIKTVNAFGRTSFIKE